MAVQINVAASQAALVNSIQAGVNAYNQRFANQNQINLSINAKAFSQPLGRITGDVKDFEAALAASNARVIAFGASTAVLGAAIRGFKELASTTIEVEKNLADINRVLGLTTGGLQKFSTDLFDVAKQTASSFNDVSKAALEFSRQGLKVEDTLQRTKDALTLARLAGMSTSAAVDSLTSSVNGFASTGITTTQVLNKLVAVEQNYAVGAGDLAEALSRTGQAAQEAGVSIDQLNALVTSAQEKTARGGAVIGNALKTIFTRLQRSETLDQLEAFNIAVRDVQGNTLPAVSILQNFAAAYKNLADSQKAQLSEQVAGVYQVNILKAIVGDLNSQQSTYSKALKDGANATNEADLATAKLNQTLSALFSQTATGTQQLANNIGKVTFEPLAREAVNTANSVIQAFNEILEGEGIGSDFANGFLKGIRNLLGGPGALAAFYTLFKLVQNSFTYLTSALPQIAGITTETQNRKNIEQAILQIMQQQGPLSQALAGHMGNEAAQAQLLLNAATARTAQMQQELALAQKLAATLSSQGVTQKGGSGLIVKSSGGYIPPATRMAETLGAKAGGYTPGRVVSSPVGGVMNTAENIKYIPGFAQPFINPPVNSKAGMAHRRNAIARTGVDPYMFGGFIPNFAITGLASKDFDKEGGGEYKILAGRIFEALLRGESYIDLTENKIAADIDIGKYKIREAKLSGKAAYQDSNFGFGKPKGANLILPKTALNDYDQKLIDFKKANIARAPFSHSFLFSKAKNIIDREKLNEKTNFSHIPLSGGFVPNFAQMSNSKIAAALRMGRITPEQAAEMGYKPSAQKIAERKGLDYVQTIPYHVIPIAYKTFNESGAALASGYGTEYENYAISALKGMGYSGVQSARQYGIPGGGNSRVDAIDPVSKAFFEMKGGHITSMAELKAKFAGVRQDLVKKYSDELLTYRDILVRNPNWEKSSAGGFIPNFAYKQAVMNLESGLSGKAAVFDTKPFPHIRNSGQPSFASAIADHGGLGNALSDSMKNQKAAGLMSRGFVPNFAPFDITGTSLQRSGGGAVSHQKINQAVNSYISSINLSTTSNKEISNAITKLLPQFNLNKQSFDEVRRAAIDYAKAQRTAAQQTQQTTTQTSKKTINERIEKATNTALFAIPMIAGQIEQFAFGNKQRTEMTNTERFAKSAISSGLTSVSTGAALGTQILGPGIGTAVGAVSGALFGLAQAATNAQLSVEELAQKDQENIEQMQKSATAGSEYIQKQQELSRLIASGATQSEINNAAKAVSSSFLAIKDTDLATAFNNTKGNVKTMGAALDEFSNNLRKRKAASDALASLREGGFFSGTTAEQGVKDANDVARNLFMAFGDNEKLKPTMSAIFEGVGKMSQIKPQGQTKEAVLIANAQRMGVQKSIMKDVEKLVEFESPKLKKGSQEFQQRVNRYLDLFFGKSAEQIAQNYSKLSEDEKKQVERIKEKLVTEANLYNTRIKLENEVADKIQKINVQILKDQSGQKLADAVFNFQQGLQSSFIDPLVMIESKRIFDIQKIKQDTEQARKESILSVYGGGQKNLASSLENEDFIKKTLAPAFENFKNTGSVSFLNDLLTKQEIAGKPVAKKQLEDIIRNYNETEEKRKINTQNQEDLINLNASLETLKGKNIEDLRKIIDEEAQMNFEKDRIEKNRKLNAETEVRALERRLADQGGFLTYGIMGEAREKANIRTQISARKSYEQERITSRTGQTAYEETLGLGRKSLLERASFEESVFGPNQATIYRAQADNLKTIKIDSKETLDAAIGQLETIKLVGEQESKRLANIRKLKEIQDDIINGRKTEADALKELNDEEQRNAERRISAKYGFQQAGRSLRDEVDTLQYRLANQIPSAFADGMTNALMEIAKGTKKIGDAFKDMVINIGQMIMQMVLKAAISKAMLSVAPSLFSQQGGLIRAQNGMYISGGRTGDRNLALLEDGEYVLNRNAVKAFGGPAALDQFNYKNAPRFGGNFQSGGGFDMAAQMQSKNDQVSYTDNLLFGNSVVGKINAGDYSAYAYENDQYFKTQREEALRKEQERVQKAFAKKQKNAQLISSIVGTIGSLGVAYGMGGAGTAGKAVVSGSKIGSRALERSTSLYGSSEMLTTSRQRGGLIGFNSGGFVPYGSRLNDTIPALLTGGEYVMNNSAVQRYGLGTLNSMNAGSYNNSTSATTNNNTHNNATNISINVDRNGKAVYGADTSSYEKQDIVMSKQMAASINQIVMTTLSNEKRYGGELYKNPLRS